MIKHPFRIVKALKEWSSPIKYIGLKMRKIPAYDRTQYYSIRIPYYHNTSILKHHMYVCVDIQPYCLSGHLRPSQLSGQFLTSRIQVRTVSSPSEIKTLCTRSLKTILFCWPELVGSVLFLVILLGFYLYLSSHSLFSLACCPVAGLPLGQSLSRDSPLLSTLPPPLFQIKKDL
jgi:hypothetical protein